MRNSESETEKLSGIVLGRAHALLDACGDVLQSIGADDPHTSEVLGAAVFALTEILSQVMVEREE